MMIHQLMIASILMVGIVRGTPTGAPNTCCEEMVPGHGVPAQNGTSSFLTIPHLVRSQLNILLFHFYFFIYHVLKLEYRRQFQPMEVCSSPSQQETRPSDLRVYIHVNATYNDIY